MNITYANNEKYKSALDKQQNKYSEKGYERILNSLNVFDGLAVDGDKVLDIGGSVLFNNEKSIDFSALFTSVKDIEYNFENVVTCDMRHDKLDYPDNTFDIVMSHETVEHLWVDIAQSMTRFDGIENFWNESYRVLKPSGIFIVSTRNRMCPLAVKQLLDGKQMMVSNFDLDAPFHIQELCYSDLQKIANKTSKFVDHECFSINSTRHKQLDKYREKLQNLLDRELFQYEEHDTIFFISRK